MVRKTTTITIDAALKLWRQGNDAGRGYAPYTDEAGEDTVEAAVEAAQRDGWEIVLRGGLDCDAEIVVLGNADSELMGIGQCNGAWAVMLSDEAAS